MLIPYCSNSDHDSQSFTRTVLLYLTLNRDSVHQYDCSILDDFPTVKITSCTID